MEREKRKIKAYQVRRALVRMGSQLENPWPDQANLRKFAIFVRQAAEALESAETEVDDDTDLYYTGPSDEASPTALRPAVLKGPPPDCDDSIRDLTAVW